MDPNSQGSASLHSPFSGTQRNQRGASETKSTPKHNGGSSYLGALSADANAPKRNDLSVLATLPFTQNLCHKHACVNLYPQPTVTCVSLTHSSLPHTQQVNDLLMRLDIIDSLHNYTYNCRTLLLLLTR